MLYFVQDYSVRLSARGSGILIFDDEGQRGTYREVNLSRQENYLQVNENKSFPRETYVLRRCQIVTSQEWDLHRANARGKLPD